MPETPNIKDYMIGIPILQEKPFIVDKIKYFSQKHSFPITQEWQYIANRMCGITCATMAISLKEPRITPLDVLTKASKLHTVPINNKNYWIQIDGLTIPIGNEIDPALPLLGLNCIDVNPVNSHDYLPVISAQRGYDHRGSKRLFHAYGIKAEKQGEPSKKITEAELKNKITSGHVFMASVINSVTPWMENLQQWGPSSHIVLITDIVTINDESWYYILDPYSRNGEPVRILRPTDNFHDVEFRGYGTSVKVE